MPKCRPLSNAEIENQLELNKRAMLWPVKNDMGEDIIYDFKVIGRSDSPSKSGLEMLTFNLEVYNNSGDKVSHRTWLPFMDEPSKDDKDATKKYYFMMGKVKNFYEAIGMEDFYKSGEELTGHEAMNKNGKCTLSIRESEQYGPSNSIDKILKKSDVPVVDEIEDDDIPF